MVSSLIESCQKHSIIPVPPKKKMTLIRIVTRFSSSYAMVRTLKSVFSAIFPALCSAPPPAPAQGDKNLISWLAGCRVKRSTNLRKVSQYPEPILLFVTAYKCSRRFQQRHRARSRQGTWIWMLWKLRFGFLDLFLFTCGSMWPAFWDLLALNASKLRNILQYLLNSLLNF